MDRTGLQRFSLWQNKTSAIVLLLTAWFLATASAQPPASTRLLLVSDRGSEGMVRLYSMNADGTQVRRITGEKEVTPEGVLSPDGKRIAFTLADPVQNQSSLYLMNADGSGKRLLDSPPKGQAFSPSWSPDGKQIAYSVLEKKIGAPGQASLWQIEADGRNRKQLGEGLIPAWSPDGKTLLYTRFDKDAKGEPALYTMDSEGGKAQRLVGSAAMGAWSPDGKHIAYMGAGDARLPDLYVSDADGAHPKQLTHVKEDMVCGPQWSSDGKKIFYTMLAKGSDGATGGFHVYVIPADGGNGTQITHEGTINFLGNGSGFFLLIGSDPAGH